MKNYQALLYLSMAVSFIGNRFLDGIIHNFSFALACFLAVIALVLFKKNSSQMAPGDFYLFASFIFLQLMEFIVNKNGNLLSYCLIIGFGLMFYGGLKQYLATYKTTE